LVTTRPTTAATRYAEVSRVLNRVLLLNLVVAGAKIWFGYVSGIVSILSDGFHSLADSASNVVALIGIATARRPPDWDHPYGHRKFETLASVGIFVFLVIVTVEVGTAAIGRLRGAAAPAVEFTSFAIMIGTVAVNLAVVGYETRAGRRLRSEVLVADARHTRSDLLTSFTVIAALVGMKLGFPLLDPIAGLVVAGFIGYTGYQIAKDTSFILSDRIVIEADELRRIVLAVPGVLGCHKIRTRGSADHVFVDLHIWLRSETRLDEAHRVSHVVKDRIMSKHPEIADAVIHIEPPPADQSAAPQATRDEAPRGSP
jgi:cation diffusion facilitator family transporter